MSGEIQFEVGSLLISSTLEITIRAMAIQSINLTNNTVTAIATPKVLFQMTSGILMAIKNLLSTELAIQSDNTTRHSKNLVNIDTSSYNLNNLLN